jgi:hypothetical protein
MGVSLGRLRLGSVLPLLLVLPLATTSRGLLHFPLLFRRSSLRCLLTIFASMRAIAMLSIQLWATLGGTYASTPASQNVWPSSVWQTSDD